MGTLRAVRHDGTLVLALCLAGICGCGPDINAAARRGSADAIREAIQRGAEVDARGEKGFAHVGVDGHG